jgi:hypothetical protein
MDRTGPLESWSAGEVVIELRHSRFVLEAQTAQSSSVEKWLRSCFLGQDRRESDASLSKQSSTEHIGFALEGYAQDQQQQSKHVAAGQTLHVDT